MSTLYSEFGHDPEEWTPVFRKIMLNRKDEIVMRCPVIAA